MSKFRLPSLGADMEEGTLVEWLVSEGQTVARGDIIAVVETQKGAIDIEVFEDGVVTRIVVQVGEKVPVGAVLAILGDDDEEDDVVEPQRPEDMEREGQVPVAAAPSSTSAGREETSGARVRIVPRARRRARDLGVDLSRVSPGSPGTAITVEDVERAAASAPKIGSTEARKQAMQRRIAQSMERANREIPHYHLGQTINLHAALTWMENENRSLPVDERLLPAAILLRAIAKALKDHPEFNGHYVDGSYRRSEGVDMGVAVSLRGGGLVAPVLADVENASVVGVMAQLRELVARARKGELRSSDMRPASVTVSNLGDGSVESVFGVIDPPQVALIGVGAVLERPWVVDGAIEPRRVVQVTLAGDHRVSNGHRGARLLARIDANLQSPESL